ncbi:hypothetical protein V0288_17900 [Pannus brasiliensis CCIBt3594]|uniref:Uncharacterized protein n=1 Tax=Pannus brasiliensis CCIBt3594 TaxID=1427578 RepID=A0AAW9R0B9_9CHRO
MLWIAGIWLKDEGLTIIGILFMMCSLPIGLKIKIPFRRNADTGHQTNKPQPNALDRPNHIEPDQNQAENNLSEKHPKIEKPHRE